VLTNFAKQFNVGGRTKTKPITTTIITKLDEGNKMTFLNVTTGLTWLIQKLVDV